MEHAEAQEHMCCVLLRHGGVMINKLNLRTPSEVTAHLLLPMRLLEFLTLDARVCAWMPA